MKIVADSGPLISLASIRLLAGQWKTDKAIEAALAAQDRVDEDLWR